MSQQVRYCCMGCLPAAVDGQPVQRGHSAYFSTYRTAAAHYTHSKACNISMRGIKTIKLLFRDADAGGAGGAGPVS